MEIQNCLLQLAIILTTILVITYEINGKQYHGESNTHLREINHYSEGYGELNSSERGPLPSNIFDKHPRLVFLGKFQEKFWYIYRHGVNQHNARVTCEGMGMKLVVFRNLEELNFIFNRTSANDNFLWTDGRHKNIDSCYEWISDNSSPGSLVSPLNHLGLVLSRGTVYAQTRLISEPVTILRNYLCFMAPCISEKC